jgi:hypothetical protein
MIQYKEAIISWQIEFLNASIAKISGRLSLAQKGVNTVMRLLAPNVAV